MIALVREGFSSLIKSHPGESVILHFFRFLAYCHIVVGHGLWFIEPYLPYEDIKALASHWITKNFVHAHFSIEFFFVIMGFLLGRKLTKTALNSFQDLFSFNFTRAVRMLPAFYGLVILAFLISFLLASNVGYSIRSQGALPYLFLYNNYLNFDSQFLQWLWFVPATIQITLFCSIACFILNKLNFKLDLSIVLIFLGLLLRLLKVLAAPSGTTIMFLPYYGFDLTHGFLNTLYSGFEMHLFSVSCGMLMYRLNKKYSFKKQTLLLGSILFFIVSFAFPVLIQYRLDSSIVAVQSSKWFLFLYSPVTTVGIAGVLWMALQLEKLQLSISFPSFITAFSRLGYSLHLTHPLTILMLFMSLQLRTLSPMQAVVLCVAIIFLSIPLALALYLFVEYPFMKALVAKNDK